MRLFLFSVVEANRSASVTKRTGTMSTKVGGRPRPQPRPGDVPLRDQIRMHRIGIGMTIRTLGELCNVADADLRAVERGKADLHTIHRIDQALGTHFLADHLNEKKNHK